MEIVSYRLRVRVPVPKYEPVEEASTAAGDTPAEMVKGTRTVYFDGDTGTETTIYERTLLPVGTTIDGPAIVEQFDATTVVPADWSAAVDGYRNLILSRKG